MINPLQGLQCPWTTIATGSGKLLWIQILVLFYLFGCFRRSKGEKKLNSALMQLSPLLLILVSTTSMHVVHVALSMTVFFLVLMHGVLLSGMSLPFIIISLFLLLIPQTLQTI